MEPCDGEGLVILAVFV